MCFVFFQSASPVHPSIHPPAADDQVRRRLLLNEFELAKAAVAGDPEANIAPIRINDDPNISFRSPYEFIYARYDRTQHLQVNA